MNRKNGVNFLTFVFWIIFSVLTTGCILQIKDRTHQLSSSDGVTYTDIGNTGEVLSIYYGTAENAVMMEQLCEDYEMETGIHVQWEAADNGTAELKKKFATDEAPDLFSIAGQDLKDWSERLADLSEQPWTEELIADAKKAASVDGHVMAWPHTLEANGIVYNKALFAQAGITKIPDSLEDLKVVCRQLEKAGIRSFGESWMQFGYLAHLFAAPFAYEEAQQISLSILDAKKTFHDLVYIDNCFDILTLTLDYGLGAHSVEYNTFYQYADFAAGNMAMMKQGTWCERTLLDLEPELEIGLFALPLSDNPEENRLLTSVTTFLCVNRDSTHKKEALRFIQWWHDHAQKYLVELNGTVLPFLNASNTGFGKLNQDMLRYMKSGNFYSEFGYEYWPADFHEDSAEIIRSFIQGLISRQETKEKLTQLYMAEGN